MDEADPHPFGDQPRGAFADLAEPGGVQRFAFAAKVREIPRDAEIGELAQQLDIAAQGRQFEMPEAQERRRDPAHDRTRLHLRMAVVEHVADHALAAADQAQRAGGRDAEVVHRLAAQELADRRTQHRAAVGAARIRGRAGALQLQFAALAIGQHGLAQRDRAAVAQLPGPMAELVAAVIGRERLHAGQQRIAGEHRGEFGRGHVFIAETELGRHFPRMRQQPRGSHRGRLDLRPQGALHLAHEIARLGIAGQGAQEGVVEHREMHGTMVPPRAVEPSLGWPRVQCLPVSFGDSAKRPP